MNIPEFDDQNCGLVVLHKDGTKDYYDPVTNDSVREEDGAKAYYWHATAQQRCRAFVAVKEGR